jgi:hypothetical protein
MEMLINMVIWKHIEDFHSTTMAKKSYTWWNI